MDWLFSDVIAYPAPLLALVQRWVASGLAGRIVCSVKLQGDTDHAATDAFAAIPGGRLMHLLHNKHELTFLWTAPPAGLFGPAGRAATLPPQPGVPSMKIAVLPVTPFQQNCSILWDEDTMKGAVIDPGGEVPRILAEIERLGVGVERIALTHGHIDHAAGAAELKDALGGVPIEGPDERDRFLLDGLAEQGREDGLAGCPHRHAGPLAEGGRHGGAGRRVVRRAALPRPHAGPARVRQRGGRFALVGDVLFRGSVGRTDFPYGNAQDLIDAIQAKLLPLGDDMVFLCGHGPGSSIGAERATNPFLRG